MGLRFKVLGRTALRLGDHQPFDARWGHSKLRGMLATLLIHGGRAIPVSELVEWLWDEQVPKHPVDTLYSYSSRLRQTLRRMNSPPTFGSKDGIYRIEVDLREVDLFEFRAAVEEGRVAGDRGDHEHASRVLDAALALWTDRPLADLDTERADNWRRWAETELWLPAQDLLLRELAALGRFELVLQRLADLPTAHQSTLSFVKRRMEALHGRGRHQDAKSYLLRMRKQMRGDGDYDEADDLLRFHETLQHGPDHAAVRANRAVEISIQKPNLLPRNVQDFTGRNELLSELDDVTTSSAREMVPCVVALDGVPGVGKTTLAVHWAHRAAERYPDGLLYADLLGYSDRPKLDTDKVVDDLLAAFGFPAERIANAAGRAAKLRDLLAGRRVLALLDNAVDSPHVEPLLDILSTCTIVVTSRRKLNGLGLRGATNLTVAPLDYQESKSWLVRRLGIRLAEAPATAEMLAAICCGNMLALRLVAQHVAMAPQVPVDELVNELRNAPTLLGLGDDGDGRDRSVRAACTWSYRILSASERRVFRLLGLHPGADLSVDLAAALTGQDRRQTERDLGLLVNAHLLTRERGDRFRLHDLLRKYAAERIAAAEHGAERVAAGERLLSYFLHSARAADITVFPFRPPVDPLPLEPGVVPMEFTTYEAAMDWYIRERPNINAVVAFAGRQGFHSYVPKLANATGEIFQRLGFFQDAATNLLSGVAAAKSLGDIEEEGNALNNLAHMALSRRDFAAAEVHLATAEERFASIDCAIGLAVATNHRGRLCIERGEFERGIGFLRQSLAMLRRADVKALEVRALHRLGEAYRRRSAYDEAASYCRDGLWGAEQIEDENGQGRCLTELALIYAEREDVASARGYAVRALALHRRQRDRAEVGKTCNLLGRLEAENGALESAERYAHMARDFCRRARDPEGEASAHYTLGRVCHARARHDEAAREWSLALTIFEDLGDPRAATVRTKLAELSASSALALETRTAPLVPRQRLHPGAP